MDQWGNTPEYMTLARGFFERALELDPRNVREAFLVGTASVDVMVSITYMTDDQATRLASAKRLWLGRCRWLPNMLSLT